MLPSTRKLKVGLALSPELISESDKYAVPLGVSRSVFFEEAMWIYLNHLDRYVNSEVKTQTQNEEALAA
ncbi:MAG: protease HtpX [Microcoleus sp.]